MQSLNKAVDKVFGFLEVPVNSAIFVVMCFVLLFQIFFRIVGIPLAWTEEIARYLFTWVIFFGGSRAVKVNQHLVVGLLPLAFKERGKQAVYLLGNAISFVFMLILCYNCFRVVQRLGVRPQYAQGSGVNMLFPYLAPAVGTAMMSIRLVQSCVQNMRRVMMSQTQEGTGK